MLKVLTGMEEASVAQALSRLFSGGMRRIDRIYSSFAYGELQVQRAGPLGRVVLSYHVLRNSRTCSCKRTLKISAGFIKGAHITK